MNEQQKTLVIESIIESLELPDSAYEKAKSRYDDIGDWFGRDESQCKDNKPHIFSQGSFRLGTAIHPIDENEPYDLDLVCELQKGITKSVHTQQFLKTKVGKEIEAYRAKRGIKAPKEEKHRCWRLNYADELSFHMDIVPCIPAEEPRRKSMFESMKVFGESEFVAKTVSELAVSITDDRHPRYFQISDEWFISNPGGYTKWFEFRMKQAEKYLNERVVALKEADIDKLPTFMWKTPLQRCVQILKRHRDQMFKDEPDLKPISMIITTLAAKAYSGETNINDAMQKILSQMGQFVNKSFPKVPNPVNPKGEDFAEKWAKNPQLEKSFRFWLQQAQNAFQKIGDAIDEKIVTGHVLKEFSISLNESDLRKRFGLIEQSTNDGLKYSGPIIVNAKLPGRHYVS
ncbi:MAG: nucleotidyltransferase [Pseudomonadota bacterium]